jgi:cytosine/adenosine deaminase-related metal-dependent hydrolase
MVHGLSSIILGPQFSSSQHMPSLQRLRARWVLPISTPPIENGEVVVEEDRIVDVRPSPAGQVSSDVHDLGNAVLMPGLVNVHTHLDYTLMRGLLEDVAFFPWIRELTARKAALTEEDWVASATIGAAEAVAGGVTTIGECTDSGAAMIGAKRIGLRGIVYQEVFGLDEIPTVEETIQALDLKVRALRWQATGSHLGIGISPHAPYTVRPDLFRALAGYAIKEGLPVCIHAAESQAEVDLIRNACGTIAEMFTRREIVWSAPGCTTVQYLDSLGALTPQTLLVHGIQLSAGDREIVRRSGAAWAHCPKSNAKLGNGIAALGLMLGCGPEDQPRVGLGSDSVASNNTIDMFEEMRFAVLLQRARSRRYDAMTARQAVELATIHGARALGMDDQIGSLEPGKQADLTAVRLDNVTTMPAYDPYNAIVYAGSARDVEMTMVAGRTLYDRGAFAYADLSEARANLATAAGKMRAWRPEPS